MMNSAAAAQEQKTVSFEMMTVKDLEALVGKPALKIEKRGKWIRCTFEGGSTSNDITISFLDWK